MHEHTVKEREEHITYCYMYVNTVSSVGLYYPKKTHDLIEILTLKKIRVRDIEIFKPKPYYSVIRKNVVCNMHRFLIK